MVDGSALLLTKLAPLPARHGCVNRRRLFDQLDADATTRLVLVTAPAGFGKTTLLSSWHASRASLPPSARNSVRGWLSLEAADNDPIRFWKYVLRALQQAHERNPGHPLMALDVSPLASTETFVTALLNACTTARWSPAGSDEIGATTLILDDYHLMTNPVIHTAMAFLLEHLPPSLHLVIASRTAPPDCR